MPVTRADIVAEARTWIGTPFQHQQSAKQVASDCIGLVRGVFREVGLRSEPVVRTQAAAFAGYARSPDGVSFKRFCDMTMLSIEIGDMLPGDVALFAYVRRMPHHCAIVGDYAHGGLSMIHSIGPGNEGEVVEHRFDDSWRKRLVAAYSIPGVEWTPQPQRPME